MPEDFQIVKYKDKKLTYEALVKPGTVLQFREGKIANIDNVLFIDEIFTNYSKGEKAKTADLQGTFNTTNVKDCLKIIVEKGEYHLSTQELKEKRDKKKREIITYIQKYYTDPKSKKAHPLVRIENAFDLIKYNVDPFIPMEQQAQACVKLMIDHLPLKKSEVNAEITIKHQWLGQCTSTIRKWCSIQSENYDHIGARYKVSLIPGDYDIFIKEIESITKGDYDIKVEGEAASNEEYMNKAAEQVKHNKSKQDAKEAQKAKSSKKK